MAPSVKLTYFDIRGLGEVIRYLLKYGGIEFEDNRISFEEWPKLKPNVQFGQLPVYEEFGKTSNQSLAISRYLAKKVKLAGTSDWENLELDALVDTINDIRQKIATYRFESDAERKEQLKQPLLNETIPFYFDRFEEIAKKNYGFLAFGRLTWADFYFASVIDMMSLFSGEDLLANRPNLQTVKSNVEDLAVIKEWITKRPKSDF